MRKFLVLLAALLAACARPPRSAEPPLMPPRPPAGPAAPYAVESAELELRVYRDGPLAQFGHNHVISSTQLGGGIALRAPRTDTSFSLELPLDSLIVDDPVLRAAAGEQFPGELSDDDRESTRRNMLAPALLDARRFPVMRLSSGGLQGGPVDYLAGVRIELRGGSRLIEVPVSVRETPGRIAISGRFKIDHTALGLSPFTAALGALRVAETIDVRFRFEAVPGSGS